jgi:DNA polymerase I
LATGEYQIVYNFFRTLRALVGQFSPDIVYFPLDGKPASRLEADPNYKANRKIDTDDPDVVKYWESFHAQKRIIISSIQKDYPIRTLFHPDQECDDLVQYIIEYHHKGDDVVVASSDTDFIQLLNKYPGKVKLYNPTSKEYRENTAYDYISWKAMVGDKADNIAGVRGIGKKTATKILSEGTLNDRLKDDKFRRAYEKSYNLIKFIDLKGEESRIITTNSVLDMDSITDDFYAMGFESMLNQSTIDKYENTFINLI